MEEDKPSERLYGPQLVFEERSFKCGYAPSTLLVSKFHQNTVFVGCKDGSVTVLCPDETQAGELRARLLALSDFKVESHIRVDGSRVGAGAVRALCEWDDRHLLLARSGGSLEVFRWKNDGSSEEAKPFTALSDCPKDPVRFLVRLDDERIAVAYRGEGLYIIDREPDGPSIRKAGGRESEPVRGIRAILPLRRGEGVDSLHWLLVTDRGGLYQWTGKVTDEPRPAEGIWEEGRRPSLISDACLLRDEAARMGGRPATEVLLATDRGLYTLFFQHSKLESGGGEARWEVHSRRLALSGLNATPMVLAYTSHLLSDGKTREYFWVTDLQGDGHLFWGDGSKQRRDRSFWRSGVQQSRSETLACALLPEVGETPSSEERKERDSAFFVVQVCRDDRIVLGRYWNPTEKGLTHRAGNPPKDLVLRELLNFGFYRGASGAQAIRLYLEDRFQEERQTEEEMRRGWWSENDAAIVAELFEYLAEDQDRRQVLLESLRAPYAETAREILKSGTADSQQASQLWRLALLGILHRSPGDQTSSYLGLLRWLRHRQVELPKEGFEDISRRLDVDLLLVRKWGLRGDVNRAREDLVEPQRILMAQEERLKAASSGHAGDQEELERLRWERLTYRAELFGRSVNLIHENDKGRLRGRTAWATAVRPYPGGTLVAVSWMWGGVELFDLKSFVDQDSAPHEAPDLEFLGGDYGVDTAGADQHTLRTDRREKSEIVPAKYGYSRVVHLGEVKGQTYLLSAPASEPAAGGVASLFVWLLPDRFEAREEIRPREIPLEGVGRASIYSLLDLGDGRLVAGLRGEGLQAVLALIEIGLQDPVPEARVSWNIPLSIGPTAAPQGQRERAEAEETRSPGRNRVWSLAKIAEPNPDRFRIAFGCDSGEIYEVTIDWKQKPLAGLVPDLIGRMGSPVQVLECRPRKDGLTRIFAGGEDGAIVAWQDISQEEPRDKPSPHFGTLWATVEQGAISQIHLLEMEGEPAVLAVTREGRYVTFDDRAQIDSPPGSGDPSRSPLPGSRHGRRSLNCSAFASSLIQKPHSLGSYWANTAEPLGAFAALLLATDDGRLRLVSLHSPEATPRRKTEYDQIVALWHEVLRWPIDFRLTEAAYKASPALSLIVVRYLLDHRLDRVPFLPSTPDATRTVQQALEESPWSLPRHLRPLFRLRVLWDQLHSGEAAGTPANYALFESLLSAVLERAWRLNDLGLFQEVCQVVLRQANAGLYRAVEAPPGKPDSAQAPWKRPRSTKEVTSNIFRSVLNAIEHSLPRWLSADRNREARARIAVAKHLVDGETARVLLRETARERRAPEESPRPFQEVLKERIRAVRELVNKRHHLVSLESLRAANLSLARMCRTLVKTREDLCGAPDLYEPGKVGDKLEACEVAWRVFKDYSDELISAAVRAFRTPLELNDAIAHEFSRSFALFICACPSATLPIESLLTERLQVSDQELEKGIFHRVLAQLKVLRAIGVGAPLWTDELVRLGTQPPKTGWGWEPRKESLPKLAEFGVFDYLNPKDTPKSQSAGSSEAESTEDPEDDISKTKLRGRLGIENTVNLGNIKKAHAVLRKLTLLIDNLETTAEGLDLSEDWRRGILDIVDGLQGDHRQSKEFFEKAFKAFPISSPVGTGDLRKVRPETVRLSQRLAHWAEDCLTNIETGARDGRLFQPEVTTYARVFRRLERVARNFPTSAAVQTNVVQGVLGHHLLEDLDEHALELEEIAEVLNPRRVWDFRDQGRRRPTKKENSTAEKFAHYLLDRARSAESIPKNLRLLQALLSSSQEKSDRQYSFRELLEPFQKARDEEFSWKADTTSNGEPGTVSLRDARYLSLVLAELDLNQRKHAWPNEWTPLDLGPEPKQKPSPTFSFNDAGALVLSFPFVVFKAEDPDKPDPSSNIGRLRNRQDKGLGSFMEPKIDPGVASSGTGFYLADLASSIVGWQLFIECPSLIEKPGIAWFKTILANQQSGNEVRT